MFIVLLLLFSFIQLKLYQWWGQVSSDRGAGCSDRGAYHENTKNSTPSQRRSRFIYLPTSGGGLTSSDGDEAPSDPTTKLYDKPVDKKPSFRTANIYATFTIITKFFEFGSNLFE